MRAILLGLGLLALGACSGINKGNKFSGERPDYQGIVEFAKWPPRPKGVAGYNLYLGESKDGSFEKINDIPVVGILVPYLKPGEVYYFKLAYVMADGREGKPGAAFTRKAAQAAKPQ
jgi:hypothetical protein